jgi:hypothetical protein
MRVAEFFTLARQAYHNPPPLPELGTGYVEATYAELFEDKNGTQYNSFV